MNRTRASALALLVLVAMVPAAHANERCAAATLRGSYGFSFSGFVQNDQGNNIPFIGAGRTIADGKGNASSTITASTNGTVSTFPWTGTYTVNPDCTGSATATPGSGGADFFFVIVNDGEELMGMATTPGNTWTIDFKRQH
jgi:hypothetical protein